MSLWWAWVGLSIATRTSSPNYTVSCFGASGQGHIPGVAASSPSDPDRHEHSSGESEQPSDAVFDVKAEWWVNDYATRKQRLEAYKQWHIDSKVTAAPAPAPAPRTPALSSTYIKTYAQEHEAYLASLKRLQDADGDLRQEPPAFDDYAAADWWEAWDQGGQVPQPEQAQPAQQTEEVPNKPRGW